MSVSLTQFISEPFYQHSLGNFFPYFRVLDLLFSYLIFNVHCLFGLVGSSGFEPPTLRLSGARSNHLSYEPLHPVSLPFGNLVFFCFLESLLSPFGWWRWRGSNPWTPCLQSRCSPNWATPPFVSILLFEFLLLVTGLQKPWKLNNDFRLSRLFPLSLNFTISSYLDSSSTLCFRFLLALSWFLSY